jgi:hypothetical protein
MKPSSGSKTAFNTSRVIISGEANTAARTTMRLAKPPTAIVMGPQNRLGGVDIRCVAECDDVTQKRVSTLNDWISNQSSCDMVAHRAEAVNRPRAPTP